MKDNNLVKKINSDKAVKVFSRLYGENEVEAARRRYLVLISEILGEDFPEKDAENTKSSLRIFTSPGRTELAGNHTDHNNGKVLAASVQLDIAAAVRERNDNVVFIRSSGFPDVKVKLTDVNGEFDLRSKSEETGTTEALVRGIAAEFKRRGCNIGGFSANAASTVHPGSGLSSSAAIESLIGRIFDSLFGGGKRSALEIAQIGQIAENIYFGKPCGLMDQTACAAGGAVAIDFANPVAPIVNRINFDLAAVRYTLCVVNTGGSHADLTADYASIPSEMKSTAKFFGKSVLREIDKETLISRAAEARKALGDRALLRSLHFFDENARVDAMAKALLEMDNADISAEKKLAFYRYLKLADESGDSSWELLQNVYSPNKPASQNIATALALTKDFLSRQTFRGACRVHGGGFAGTIQVYIPLNALDAYKDCIEAVFGKGSVTPLWIRPTGAVELEF